MERRAGLVAAAEMSCWWAAAELGKGRQKPKPWVWSWGQGGGVWEQSRGPGGRKGAAAGLGLAGSCTGSESLEKGLCGVRNWPLASEYFPPLPSRLAAQVADLRVGRPQDYHFCSTASFPAPLLDVAADE